MSVTDKYFEYGEYYVRKIHDTNAPEWKYPEVGAFAHDVNSAAMLYDGSKPATSVFHIMKRLFKYVKEDDFNYFYHKKNGRLINPHNENLYGSYLADCVIAAFYNTFKPFEREIICSKEQLVEGVDLNHDKDFRIGDIWVTEVEYRPRGNMTKVSGVLCGTIFNNLKYDSNKHWVDPDKFRVSVYDKRNPEDIPDIRIFSFKCNKEKGTVSAGTCYKEASGSYRSYTAYSTATINYYEIPYDMMELYNQARRSALHLIIILVNEWEVKNQISKIYIESKNMEKEVDCEILQHATAL